MLAQFHFICGLPRSGSTLLSALLRQNPRFHAGMSSPVGNLLNGMLGQLGAGSEFGPLVTTEQRRRLGRGLFDAYYADHADKAVIFDTNRGWSGQMAAALDMFPRAKFIACVRNVAWVMDSIEQRYRADPYEITKLFTNDAERNDVYSRVEALAQRNRMVGGPWAALKQAFYSNEAENLLVVDYDLLAQAPDKVLKLIYDFIGEPWFEHDYQGLNYDEPAFDRNLGLPNLHKVREKVALQHRRSVLPPDLFAQYSQLSFWQHGADSAARVIAVKPPPDQHGNANVAAGMPLPSSNTDLHGTKPPRNTIG
ncbi:sulfotransferase [Pigmentiphaga aceris]|uniref:Sulfotransferase n=1 Tax=Pigmentiphaga aceris TaxID=1940612 RepID=A0A5C0ART3_9BURK|nr:sulfotransferase [Pigmentiphaga aceris]QEI04818.1 sulfotransferase [Pigmentiphaga aceris]